MVWVVPLSDTKLISRTLTPMLGSYGIRSLSGFGKLVSPLVHSVLYPHNSYMRLYLNIFRRERAISGFDWPFTPSHKSSLRFSALQGSVLHQVLPQLQPAHGQITRFRVYPVQLYALLTLAFAPASQLNYLTLLHRITRWAIKQKVRCQPVKGLQLLVSIWFQVLFHSPSGVLFTFPSRYWFTIGHLRVFSLRRWSSQIPTEFHVLRGTRE